MEPLWSPEAAPVAISGNQSSAKTAKQAEKRCSGLQPVAARSAW
jgi:hypothetical protein